MYELSTKTLQLNPSARSKLNLCYFFPFTQNKFLHKVVIKLRIKYNERVPDRSTSFYGAWPRVEGDLHGYKSISFEIGKKRMRLEHLCILA